MSSSGGGGAAYVAPTYTDPVNGMTFKDSGDLNSMFMGQGYSSGSDALNAEITYRQSQEKAASDLAKQQAIDLNGRNESSFQTQLTNATNNARTTANQYFTDHGYDPNLFTSQLANAINSSVGSVQDPYANYVGTSTAPGSTTNANGSISPVAANPGAAFDPNLGATILGQVNSGYQSKAGNAIDQLFSPTYAQDNISSSWLDPAVSSVLSSQFDPLSSQLTNALKRGTLNQQGYDAANAKMTTDRTNATSTVNNLGSNIISNDQKALTDYITGAKNSAANVNANTYGAFDPNSYATGAQNLVGKDQANFAGDLGNAVGSTSFSDLASLLNAGGVVQGANDPTAANPTTGAPGSGGVSDAYIAQQALAKQPRGLGSQGSF